VQIGPVAAEKINPLLGENKTQRLGKLDYKPTKEKTVKSPGTENPK